ncbi:MAG: ATP-dependent DNA helicase RecG [Balneolaceae bacterium]|nr:ATP-dependent DNA helicase RecG [Balneolaceae bacterium]
MFHPSLKISSPRLKALNKAELYNDSDLINFAPRRYLDRQTTLKIFSLQGVDEDVTVIGTVEDISVVNAGRKRLEVIISDDTGQLKCVWFKGISYFSKSFDKGDLVSVYGKPKQYGRWISIAHPDVDKLNKSNSTLKTMGIIPVYPGNSFFKKTYITTAVIQKWIRQLLNLHTIEDFLPGELLANLSLSGRYESYCMLHFPDTLDEARLGRKQLVFEELFLFELAIHYLKLRQAKKSSTIGFDKPGSYTHAFFTRILPFKLTEGQTNALRDIRSDYESGRQMNRLLQGDVGSGKTVVAIGAILMMLDNGYQTAFMAPTEILAEQHYRTLIEYLNPLGVDIRLLTGKRTPKQKEEITNQLASGSTQIVVGTHAIIQDSVSFNRLGLVVVDEQHRFGVMQRSHFITGDSSPHLLSMSATPIPRSLALSVFGKLDISIVKGLPAGRKPVRTAVRTERKRDDVYIFTESVLKSGGQVYIVYPLVEESEALDLQNAVEAFELIKRRFPAFKAGLLHGKMKSDEKDEVMTRFAEGDVQILVSTTVIEVGINVPNASVMIIEHAERFGLSQLHQLRGRIGRGSRESFCILMTGNKQTNVAKQRLKTMVDTNDGFVIAEVDLKLRGPGDFLGTRQSGLPEFKHADLVDDEELLKKAALTAEQLLKDDPGLKKPEHLALSKKFKQYLKERESFFEMM